MSVSSPTADQRKKRYDEIHATVKTVAEKDSMAGVRTLATLLLRYMELNEVGAIQTQLPDKHHK